MTFDKKDSNEIKEDYKNNSDNKNLGLDNLLNELYKDYKKQIEIKNLLGFSFSIFRYKSRTFNRCN